VFWQRLISETRRKHTGIVFVAETLGCVPSQTVRTAKTGFNFIFNSSCWWDFSSGWLMEQYNLTRGETDSVSFPESHDTPRLAAELDGNVDALKQRYLFSAFFSAGVMMPIGFEFGFRKRLHVVNTRSSDWEQTSIDLTDFIRRCNHSKSENPVFHEDAPTSILRADNPNILFMWKGSTRTSHEALLILNRDIHHHQHFHANLYRHIGAAGPLTDVSPEHRLDFLPTPFEYNLRPAQGIVLVTGK
jgi:starch synthase (maltosyl-transferring)